MFLHAQFVSVSYMYVYYDPKLSIKTVMFISLTSKIVHFGSPNLPLFDAHKSSLFGASKLFLLVLQSCPILVLQNSHCWCSKCIPFGAQKLLFFRGQNLYLLVLESWGFLVLESCSFWCSKCVPFRCWKVVLFWCSKVVPFWCSKVSHFCYFELKFLGVLIKACIPLCLFQHCYTQTV